jgi:CheY-like chemotaxis protein
MRVLVIEASPEDVAIFKRRIGEAGSECEFQFLSDGAEALDYLSHARQSGAFPLPDLIILSLNLPKIDGLVLLVKLKDDASLRRIPVVVFSGSEREEDMVRAYDCGAASYVTKLPGPEAFQRLAELLRDVQSALRSAVRGPD